MEKKLKIIAVVAVLLITIIAISETGVFNKIKSSEPTYMEVVTTKTEKETETIKEEETFLNENIEEIISENTQNNLSSFFCLKQIKISENMINMINDKTIEMYFQLFGDMISIYVNEDGNVYFVDLRENKTEIKFTGTEQNGEIKFLISYDDVEYSDVYTDGVFIAALTEDECMIIEDEELYDKIENLIEEGILSFNS